MNNYNYLHNKQQTYNNPIFIQNPDDFIDVISTMMEERQMKLKINKTYTKPAEKTFEELFDIFLREKRIERVAEKTVKDYVENINVFKNFLKNTYGVDIKNFYLSSLNAEHILKFKEVMKENGNSDTTVNTRLTHLKSFVNYTIRKGFVNTLIEIKKIKVRKENTKLGMSGDKKLLNKKEINTILKMRPSENINELFDWMNAVFLIELGIRVQTLWNIKKEDIDFENGVIHLRHLKCSSEEYSKKYMTENFKECLIYYFNILGDSLEKLRKEYDKKINEKCKLMNISLEKYINSNKEEYESKCPGLFPFVMNDRGERVALETINTRAKRFTKKHFNKKINAHNFRHSLGTIAANNGATQHQLQQLLGHKSSASTQCYLHITDESKKNVDITFSASAIVEDAY